MAYFHCLIGGGSSGGGYELTVTCDADFAGSTITCTDGVTTLTKTCPSVSPYEVVFEIPNGGDWTISGVVGGHTVSTGVSIPTSASLIATIQQTVIIHSAKEDTISYVDIDGATQTITFASGETSKQVTIEIDSGGSSITFTSSVAKDPSNLANDYSKTVTITENTTDVYVMPDNVLYWWGYVGNIEAMSTANGWTSTNTFVNPTWNGNSISFSLNTNYYIMGIGTKSPLTLNSVKFHFIGNWSVSGSGVAFSNTESSKQGVGGNQVSSIFAVGDIGSTEAHYVSGNITTNNEIIGFAVVNASANATMKAWWYE